MGGVFSDRGSGRLSIRVLFADEGASISLAMFSSVTSSLSSRTASNASFLSEGGVGC